MTKCLIKDYVYSSILWKEDPHYLKITKSLLCEKKKTWK